MSGGTFEYIQYRMDDLAEDIETFIKDNGNPDEYGFVQNYSEETIKELKQGVRLIKLAALYTHRIDWFLAGDDGEDNFHEKIKEDLARKD